MIAAVKVLCTVHPGMGMLQAAWQHGGEDPWRLHHMLDDDLRPTGDPAGDAVVPKHPERQRAMRMAFGAIASEQQIKLAGGKVQRRA